MDTTERVEEYLASQPETKQTDLRDLHAHMLAEFPECGLWLRRRHERATDGMGHLGGERIALGPDAATHVAARREFRAHGRVAYRSAPGQLTTATLVVSGPRPSWQ